LRWTRKSVLTILKTSWRMVLSLCRTRRWVCCCPSSCCFGSSLSGKREEGGCCFVSAWSGCCSAIRCRPTRLVSRMKGGGLLCSLDLQGVGTRTSQIEEKGKEAHRPGTLLCFLYDSRSCRFPVREKMLELGSAFGTSGVQSGTRDHLYKPLDEEERLVDR
jgi:hypothetical protein